jgi:UTP:GlnB (protein PII) uridylyltransferase
MAMAKHIVDIPHFVEVFAEMKQQRKQVRISRDYLHRMLTALKSSMEKNEVIILRARIDGTPFSDIAQEIQGPNGKPYTRQRIAQLEREAIHKITTLQMTPTGEVIQVAESHHAINGIYDNPPGDDFDILEGPSDEELKALEAEGY